MPRLELVSHALCPYVQRAAIALSEKGVPFTRTVVDLDDKPAWFTALSPLGKVPLLRVDDAVLFESAVICDYLDETIGPRLHPADPLERARHRAWIEFASAVLNDIWRLYTAPDPSSFEARLADLRARFGQLEAVLGEGPYFAGADFSLVDAAFGPVFRYFDVFETFASFRLFEDLPKVRGWRQALAARPSVRTAVAGSYHNALRAFVVGQKGHLGRLALEFNQAA
ncbi:MAG TPA: glutathione S-transferase family protein [Rubellimicrobium sp.]|nr:glutathione S-transferase family protein [Rubellimicrobium sp.]